MMQTMTTLTAATAFLAAALIVVPIANSALVKETNVHSTVTSLRYHRAAQEQASNFSTIVETIEAIPSLSKFEEALVKANLLEELRNYGTKGQSLTVFMPFNDAFDALSPDLRAKLFDAKWIAHLREILLYHIHKGEEEEGGGGISATDMMEFTKLEMENGEYVSITTATSNQEHFLFNTAQEIGYSALDNGSFGYMIDKVLMPSFVTTSLLHVVSQEHIATSTFASLVVTVGLESTLNDPNVALTVLAPSNAAFSALGTTMLSYLQSTDAGLVMLKQVVLYHILPYLYASSTFAQGSSQITTLNGNSVDIVRDDIIVLVNGLYLNSPNHVANNGIVHVLGKVLIPPGINIPTATTTDPETNPAVPTDPSMATLVNVVSETSNLSSLAQAIVAAGDMNDVLSDAAGPYTLFAPIDAAFDMFPTVQDVYMSDSSAWILHLQEVLKFHVTKTMITADVLKSNIANDEWMIPMLNGENAMVTATRNRDNAILLSPAVMGTATISGVEMSAINGNVHVINRILLPSFVFTNMLEHALASNAALGSLVESPDLEKFVEYLNSKPGITFFAPSHAALSAMGEQDVTMEELFFYHTVEMVLPSNSISPGTTRTVRSVQGGDLTITKSSNGDLFVNGVAVVSGPDNLARDGIVHVIDRVLTIPETTTITTTKPGQPVPQPVQEPANQPQPVTSITVNATCSSNPQCSPLNIGGDCCPTAESIMLDCCFTITTQQQQQQQGSDNVISPNMITSGASCSSHTRCAGLAGDCCPSSDNIYLDCCDS